MINSRSIDDLHPRVANLCRQFIAACADNGIKVIITSTFRDNESQNQLYAQGRTLPGKVVTNAKAGQSFHNYKLAFDFAIEYDNQVQWRDSLMFFLCGQIAKKLGLEWAGDWIKITETAHCQFTNGLTLKELQEGKTLPN